MTRYAEGTAVASEQSRAEIERTLARYKATGFMYGWQGQRAFVGFEVSGRAIRFVMTMPDPNDRRFWITPATRRPRSPEAAAKEHDQAVRQRWRALALVIKAKLEAVESGITEFDAEFMAHIVMPDGQTMGQTLLPRMREALERRQPPPMLPDYSAGGSA